MHRSMEKNWKLRNISSHIWTINFQQRSKKHTVEEKYYLQTAVLGKLDGHMKNNQSLSHTHCMVGVYYIQRSTQNVLKCIISDKGLIWKLYKTTTQQQQQKDSTTHFSFIKQWAEELNRHFSEEDIQMANRHKTDVQQY